MKDLGRAWSAFIDGKGKFAENASFKEPDFKWIREKIAGGGMSGEISAPMMLEEQTATLTMYTYDLDAMRAFGLSVKAPQSFIFRRELFDTRLQTTSAITIRMLATMDIEFPEWDRKRLEGVKIPLFIVNYRRFRNGVLELHHDPESGIFADGSGNLLSESSRAIGRR
ncbi:MULTISPECIES: phage major tail tube protein [unclassified Shinella]|uniref:phage major tail tube protein n=1 Tax=unclassified Shinella TaxID=2643062 RepID=UPI00225D51E4|nr:MULTISPECIES: phage major tail tube protein [unclassified Shinella]CAI0339143.1 conserved hypothetical protein [Rhizobiaceae bacterium]CAK7257558.1 Phage tail protein [Shinella sp. WSC3-e]MCO5138986.1 phage major tail tube protein [Shinella sp.]MCW5708666.1 phage major tail tube protein [Shinella sp.]MDC7256285.1 phage major tail tube protein [Shinella sp. YE25]